MERCSSCGDRCEKVNDRGLCPHCWTCPGKGARARYTHDPVYGDRHWVRATHLSGPEMDHDAFLLSCEAQGGD